MSKRLIYKCNLCSQENESPMDFYGFSHTVHNPPLGRSIVLPESRHAASHICKACVDTILRDASISEDCTPDPPKEEGAG